ncbi:PLP-dependent transferase [Streptomyces sp. NPDC088801]|uniref:PLP-dependent transferase n=1 Tax=Streptomyces sp. NPDC088801 TaxID=3365903 RepID=UPI00382F9873
MTETSAHGLSTRSVHAGERRDAEGAIHTPLYNHSTFAFDTTADLLDVVEGRKSGNLYTRYGLNPTIRSTEGNSPTWKTASRPWRSPPA